jgi:hypothetical protein
MSVAVDHELLTQVLSEKAQTVKEALLAAQRGDATDELDIQGGGIPHE